MMEAKIDIFLRHLTDPLHYGEGERTSGLKHTFSLVHWLLNLGHCMHNEVRQRSPHKYGARMARRVLQLQQAEGGGSDYASYDDSLDVIFQTHNSNLASIIPR
jgi:hypothetical protein